MTRLSVDVPPAKFGSNSNPTEEVEMGVLISKVLRIRLLFSGLNNRE